MSATIDERVVEMRFDNKHFESNVAQSMSTLDKLKAKLRLSDASKGLDNLNTAAKNVNMTGLGSAVETVTAKFSALQVMGVTALANITNSAVNAGKQIVKSLTIDPVMSGFSEYETKMGSIQTILANTEHQGTTLDQVTAALDELNLYADKTIYNFQEMTRNIGTFTAAGVDLDTSVRSIQGIANLAAVSGSTSQQASTAMYQLSQALATGTVKLMDWNSVVNAGMGGKVFQNALIQTAAMLDGSAKDVEAWQKKNIDAFGSFRDSLTQGEWLTGEVLTRTLEQFTMAAEEGSAQWEEYKKSLMDTGYTEAQAEAILKMANTATDAATKVKTFTQLMDTLKESAQSGWAQTWELIIGDFEEAKAFFTELSTIFGGILESSANRRNALFGDALSSNWDKLIGKINEAGIETEKFEASIREVVGDKKLDPLIEKYGSLEAAIRKGKISSDDLKKALDGISGTKADTKISGFVDGLKEIERTLRRGNVGEDVKKLQTALDELGYDLGKPGIDGIIGPITEKAIKAFQEANGILADGVVGPETLAALEKAGTKVTELTGDVDDLKLSASELIDEITKTSGRELLLDSLMNVIKAIQRPLSAVGEAFRNTFSVTPDQLYNALEWLNKFTSKFVPKGILDANTWKELTDNIASHGVKVTDFISSLGDVLKDNGIDIQDLIKKYGSLSKAFEAGAISIEHIKDALVNLGLSEALINGGENMDKLRRAFEGLFAVFDIFGTIVGGGLKFGLDVLSLALSKFDMNILDLAATIGDSLSAFRDWIKEGNLVAKMFDSMLDKLPGLVAKLQAWFDVFKQTPAVQKLVDSIEAVRDAFDKLMNGDIDVSEFATSLGTNLANALKSLPEIAMQIASDFIAGFVGGLGSGISGVISTVVGFCLDFVAAFAAALGVQSPSWKAFEIAEDFIQGFINGITNMIGAVVSVLKNIGKQVVELFKSLWDYITDESGRIQWGKIIAGGIIGSVLWILAKFATAFGGIADAFGSLDNIFENTADAIKSFKKVLDGYAWDMKAKAVQKLAISVAILAASIWVLAQVEDIGKLWNAVGVITALSAVVVALAFAMGKLSDASISYSKEGGLNVKGITSSLLQIAIVIAAMAGVVKLIGSMDTGEAIQGFIGLVGVASALLVFMKVLGKISLDNKGIGQLGTTMIKLSIAMALLVGVFKLIDGLSAGEALKGVAFAAAFAVFVRSITAIAKTAGNNVSKVGGMMIKLSIAMGLMVGVVKMVSGLSAGEMLKGAAFAAAFTVFVKELVRCTKIGKNQQIAKLGGLLLSISTSLLLMVGVCKLVGMLSAGEIIKGAAFVTGFVFFLKALVGVLKVGSEQKMAKVAATMIALSVSIAILAGVAALLGQLNLGDLAKGVAAVSALGLVMTGMVKALKGAQNVAKSVMWMAIAIGMMAAAVIALSFVDPADLAPATLALGMLMGMFALMVKAGSAAKVSLASTTIMMGVVIALAGILAILSSFKLDGMLEVAGSLSLLMISLGATMRIIGNTGELAPGAWKGLGILVAVVAGLAVILGLMAKFDAEPSIETAKSLSMLLLTMTGVTAILSMIGPGAMAAVQGALGLMGVVAVIGVIAGAIGGLMSLIPEDTVSKWKTGLENFMDFITILATGLGEAIGGFIGGIGEGLMNSFSNMVDTFGTAVDKLKEVSTNAASIKGENFDGVEKLIEIIGDIASATMGSTWSDIWTSGGTSMERFQTDGVAFFESMKAISESATGISIDETSFDSVMTAAEKLVKLQSKIEPIGGVISWFSGRTDLGTFGTNVSNFVGSMETALEGLDGVTYDPATLTTIIDAAKDLAKLQSSLEPIGGVMSWFDGRDDLGTFGVNIAAFMISMNIALGSLTGATFNTEGLNTVITATKDLAKLQSSLEPIGGVMSWFDGRDDLGTFGINVAGFIASMKIALGAIDGVTFNTEGLGTIITAAKDLTKLQASLEPIDGLMAWLDGRDDLSTFGIDVAAFITSMKTALSTLEGATLDETALGSVITAAKKLSELQSDLEPIGSVMDWFNGRQDLGTFGEKVGQFASAMGALKTAMGEDGITEGVVTSITNAGNALIALQQALPEETWFDGKMDLTTFSNRISSFATAMGTFGTSTAEIDFTKIDTSIAAAYKIKSLINSLVDLDTSGLNSFAGVGLGDGSLVNMGQAIGKYGEAVADLDVEAVNTSVTTAIRLKNLISSLAGLDSSGISNFKVGSVGKSIGSYASSVSGVDYGAVSASISAANRLKTFIIGLSGMDTSGIDTFKTAISELGTVGLDGVVQAFSSKTGAMLAAATNFINAMATGITSGTGTVTKAMQSTVDKVMETATASAKKFIDVGKTMSEGMADGIDAKKSSVSSAAKDAGKEAVSGASSQRSEMEGAGRELGEGLVIGIRGKISAAYQAGYDLGAAAVRGERDGQNSASPSKETIKAGKWLGEGLVIGINSMGRAVYKAGGSMGSDAVSSISKSISRISDVIDSDIDAQPTIRPVMDLSNVDSGISAIRSMFNEQSTIRATANVSAISTMMNRRAQNGANSDVVSAIDKLRKDIGNIGGNSYTIGGVSYDDGSSVGNAVNELVRAIRMEGRI